MALQEGEAKRVSGWWNRTQTEDLEMYLLKNEVYGNADLRIIGFALKECDIRNAHVDTLPEEIGIAFYALGKVARILSAYDAGEIASEDSWKDLAIYATMGRMAGKAL